MSQSSQPASPAQSLKRTPLHDVHVALGAKMVPFAGYEMPVQYPAGVIAEHRAVRTACGLFDVSHMGEFVVRGPQALDFVNYVTTNDASTLAVGQAQYSAFCNERGTIEDDCLVYRFDDHYMLVVNASNAAKDWELIGRHAGRFDVDLEDVSDDTALLALQGPKAQEVLARHTDIDLDAIKYYHFVVATVAGVSDVIVSRTGYTGEDGFELYFSSGDARRVWEAVTAQGDVQPCGLGARDTLRLEMGMALYGNDIDDETSPYEANMGWIVKLKKGDFVGREALERAKEQGASRKLVGFTFEERAIPRHGYPVFYEGAPSGEVRSGTMSPSLGIPIGTAYLPPAGVAEGTRFEVEIRGKRVPARVVKPPFYKDASHR
ncbi:MAG TPA: glycine cleavage system aminomethyltransferase GcvT [Gemmatimonadaceae bacterium]|nr:glycine cleavage system aminomethyltransferase GcvT [Gemmatimonadaceae bacterium]